MAKRNTLIELIILAAFVIAPLNAFPAGPANPITLASAALFVDGKPVDSGTFKAFLEFYRYDKSLPLQVEIKDDSAIGATEVVPAHRKIKLYFLSTHDERVAAILWLPAEAKSPFPCSLYLHGLGQKKETAEPYAHELLKEGYAVMALDAAYHGERQAGKLPMYGTNFYRMRDGYIQTVVDYRRALDYLESRPDIDGHRLTLIGMSMGAIMGSVLAGVDNRIKCPVLLVGGADRGMMSRLSQLPTWRQIRAEKPDIDFDELSRIFAPSDPLNFVDKISPRPVLMINGKQDLVVPIEANKLLHNTAKEPKKIVWLDSGHALPINQTVPIIRDWFKRYL